MIVVESKIARTLRATVDGKDVRVAIRVGRNGFSDLPQAIRDQVAKLESDMKLEEHAAPKPSIAPAPASKAQPAKG